jgi:hypothetical protein
VPSLDALLSSTLFFTADAGNAAFESQPLPTAGPPFSPPTPTPSAAGAPEDQPIWSWTHDPADVTAITGITAKVRPMNFMTMTALDRVSFGPVEIEDPNNGQAITLPLDNAQLVRRSFLPFGNVNGVHPIWRLPAKVDASLLLVFAFERDPNDPTNFIPPFEATMASDDFMPPPNVDAFDQPLRIVVCCELVLCKERPDFEPLGVMAAGRIHPHVMVISNQPLTRATVTVSLARPTSSSMSDPSMSPNIGMGLFTDTNDNGARLSSLTSGINAILGAVGAPVPPPIPLWDNIFDYYRIDPQAGTSLTVVDPAAGHRTVNGAIETLDLITALTPFVTYSPMSFDKVVRQGTYDNMHISPKMLVGLGGVVAPDPTVMAPVCAHDCFHMHWRWGAMWSGPGMSWLPNNFALNGWNLAGVPYADPGAPQVPFNQRVGITIMGPTSLDYQAEIQGVASGAWQFVLHHGAAYSIGLAAGLQMFFDALIPTVNIVLAFRNLPTLPASATSWTMAQWALFYAVIRFQPTLVGPKERINIIDRALAEAS